MKYLLVVMLVLASASAFAASEECARRIGLAVQSGVDYGMQLTYLRHNLDNQEAKNSLNTLRKWTYDSIEYAKKACD